MENLTETLWICFLVNLPLEQVYKRDMDEQFASDHDYCTVSHAIGLTVQGRDSMCHLLKRETLVISGIG